MKSLPSRERGLKYKNNPFFKLSAAVAPLAGAWVEISSKRYKTIGRNVVAPLAGAWVEINRSWKRYWMARSSLPSRERGLKLSFE